MPSRRHKLSDGFFTTQSVQHNADLFFGRVLLARCPANVLDCLGGTRLSCLRFLFHLHIHTIYGFRRRPYGRLWSGLSLHLTNKSWVRCPPSSLYTFPYRDLARDCHFTGFPDFDEFSLNGFPMRTQFKTTNAMLYQLS